MTLHEKHGGKKGKGGKKEGEMHEMMSMMAPPPKREGKRVKKGKK